MTEGPHVPLARTLLFVALVSFGPMSIDLYLPSLPDMTTALATSVSGAQLTLSVFAAMIAVGQLIYGPLSDRFGRRPTLLAGVALYIVGTGLCLTASGIAMLVVWRAVQALGACAGPVLARAAVRDLYSREQAARMLSVLAASMSISPAVAPIVGSFLVPLGWRANFVVMAAFGILVWIGSWYLMVETNRQPDLKALRLGRMVDVVRTLARDRIFIGNTTSVALVFSAIFSFLSVSSFVVIEVLGVPAGHFGYFFAATIIAFMAGSTIAARLGHRVGLERMIRIGVAIGCTGGAAMLILALAGEQTVAAVIAPVSCMSLGVGLVLPNSTAVALAPHPTVAGTASAVLGAAQMGWGALVGWVAGEAHDGTTLPLAVFMAAGWFATALVHATLLRRSAPPPAAA